MAGFEGNLITCFLLLTCKQIRRTSGQMNNEELHVGLRARIYHRSRKRLGRGESFRKEERQRNPGDVILTSARHSPILTDDLVRMTLVGERE